jgi:transketolase
LVKDKDEANKEKEVAEKPKPKATRVTSKQVLEEINQLDGKMDSLGTRVDSLAASMKTEQKVAAVPLQSPWLGLFVVGIAAAAVGTILLAISQSAVIGLCVVGIGAAIGAIASIRLWGKGYQKQVE